MPFANAVNIGTGFRGSAIMDESAPTSLNTEQVPANAGDGYSSLFQVFDKLGKPWGGCVRSRLGGYDLTDTAPSKGVANSLFTPYFGPDEPDSGGYANSYLRDNGNTDKYKKYAFYRDSPQGYGLRRRPELRLSGRGHPAADQRQNHDHHRPGQTEAQGHTVVPEGLAWGWRVISPGAPFTEGVPYDDPDTMKVIILLTGMANDVGGGGNGNYKTVFTSYGYADNGYLGATNGSNAEATLNTKLSTLVLLDQGQFGRRPERSGHHDLHDRVCVAAGLTIDSIMSGCASDSSKHSAPRAQTTCNRPSRTSHWASASCASRSKRTGSLLLLGRYGRFVAVQHHCRELRDGGNTQTC